MRTSIGAAAAALALGLAGSAGATIVDISALSGDGVTLNLAAGDYTITYAADGLYDAWNAWGSVSGCSPAGDDCDTGWLAPFTVDAGGDIYSYFLPIDDMFRSVYATPALAFAAYSAGPLSVSHNSMVSVLSGPITLSLAAQTSVRFYVADFPYNDNSGGVSLDVSPAAVPEPATWALMLLGFGAGGALLRRRSRATA